MMSMRALLTQVTLIDTICTDPGELLTSVQIMSIVIIMSMKSVIIVSNYWHGPSDNHRHHSDGAVRMMSMEVS